MRDSISKSISNTIRDLNKSGLVDDITMRNVNNLCLPEIKDYSPEQIISIRKKLKLSQAALASVFNVSASRDAGVKSMSSWRGLCCRNWREVSLSTPNASADSGMEYL